MRFMLKEYLQMLEGEEIAQPPDKRRAVPGLYELAEAIDVSEPTMNRIANNKGQLINGSHVDAIIKELRDRGFDTDLCDILVYDEEEWYKKQDVPADLVAA